MPPHPVIVHDRAARRRPRVVCSGAVTVPKRLSIITGELRKSIVGGPPNLASTIALHSRVIPNGHHAHDRMAWSGVPQ
jgi:hypothetical protein